MIKIKNILNAIKNMVNGSNKIAAIVLATTLGFSFIPAQSAFANDAGCAHANVINTGATGEEGTYHVKQCQDCFAVLDQHLVTSDCDYCINNLGATSDIVEEVPVEQETPVQEKQQVQKEEVVEQTKECNHQFTEKLIGYKDSEYVHVKVCDFCGQEESVHDANYEEKCDLCERYFSEEYAGLKNELESKSDNETIITVAELDNYEAKLCEKLEEETSKIQSDVIYMSKNIVINASLLDVLIGSCNEISLDKDIEIVKYTDRVETRIFENNQVSSYVYYLY